MPEYPVKLHNIIDRVYVGSDLGVPEAKQRKMTRLAACKDGPDGHRAMLGYTTLGAPKDSEYLWAHRGTWGAMNVIDNDDSSMIATSMIFDALRWVKKHYDAGETIFFHCNHGHERGPVMALMFLRMIGEMPCSFSTAKKIFGRLYRPFDNEGRGLMMKARELWNQLPGLIGES